MCFKEHKEITYLVDNGTLKPPYYHALGNQNARDIKEVCSVNMDA